MVKKILFMAMLVVGLLGMDEAYSMNPLDRSNSSYNYGTFWRLNSGTYNYDVAFYENASDPDHTMVGRCPFTTRDGTVINNYNDIITKIIIPGTNAFNNLISGFTFTYDGSYSTTSDYNGYQVSDVDNTSEIEVKWGGGMSFASWDQLSNKGEFGILFGIDSGLNISGLIHNVRHEMLHCLGFSHKNENYYGFGNPNWSPKSDGSPFGLLVTGNTDPSTIWQGCEDTLYGIDTVYNTGNEALKIEGYVTNYYSDGYAEAYLADAVTTKILYQAPIDKTGKFEFRVKSIPPNPMRIVACDSSINKNYSVVKGTDDNTYVSKLDHTSSDDNKPVTSANWSTYWMIRDNTFNRNGWSTGKNYKQMFSNMRYQFTSNLPIPPGANYYNVGNISLDRVASTVEGIQADSGIKMVYP